MRLLGSREETRWISTQALVKPGKIKVTSVSPCGTVAATGLSVRANVGTGSGIRVKHGRFRRYGNGLLVP
jgi:hypothetical protein